MTLRQEKVNNLMKKLSAEFFQNNSSPKSLITVTDFNISSDLKKGTVFITVLPEKFENEALSFAKRQRSDLREHLRSHTDLKALPYIDVRIDEGEKNRQKVDSLLAE